MFSDEFIMPTVAFLIYDSIFFHDFVSASSNGIDCIIHGSNPAGVFSVYYMDLVHTISPVIKELLWMGHAFKHNAWSTSALFASLIIHKRALSYHTSEIEDACTNLEKRWQAAKSSRAVSTAEV